MHGPLWISSSWDPPLATLAEDAKAPVKTLTGRRWIVGQRDNRRRYHSASDAAPAMQLCRTTDHDDLNESAVAKELRPSKEDPEVRLSMSAVVPSCKRYLNSGILHRKGVELRYAYDLEVDWK